jgi:hypothetical protein
MSELKIAGAAAKRAGSPSSHFEIDFDRIRLSRARSRLTA